MRDSLWYKEFFLKNYGSGYFNDEHFYGGTKIDSKQLLRPAIHIPTTVMKFDTMP